jgi:hypothetical protein
MRPLIAQDAEIREANAQCRTRHTISFSNITHYFDVINLVRDLIVYEYPPATTNPVPLLDLSDGNP